MNKKQRVSHLDAMNSSYIPNLLSEALPGECQLSVLEKKCTCWYIDDLPVLSDMTGAGQNLQMVPPGRAEAGVGVMK
jgi:hypothetical protein